MTLSDQTANITQDNVDQVHNAMFEGICSWYLPRLLVWNAVVYEQMSCIRNSDKEYNSLLEMSDPCIGDEWPMHWWWVAHALVMEWPMHWWWVAHALVMSCPCIGASPMHGPLITNAWATHHQCMGHSSPMHGPLIKWPMHWWWVAQSSLLVWILVHIVYQLPQCTIMCV